MKRPADDHFDASSGDSSAPAAGIRHVVVRRLPDGQVIRCGTVHALTAERGQTLVVQTNTGRWLAECLVDDAAPSGALAGELLHVATAEDRQRARQAAVAADLLRAAAEQHVQQAGLPIVVVAAEIDLQQDTGVVRFLGQSAEPLGPLAVLLAGICQLQRVQWAALENETSASAGPSSDEILDQAFWERFEAISQPGPSLGQSLGKEFRTAAGNRGLYQQKRRGPSPPLRQLPAGRSWMLRVRTAAGGITASQLCSLLELAEQFGDGSLRLTVRQAIQLHGVAPAAGDEVLQQLAQRLLSTVGSCGNAVRNPTCCPLPLDADPQRWPGQRDVRELALRLARDLLPRGPAFEFRFHDAASPPTGHTLHSAEDPANDAVTAHVLPHKFKVGVASDRHDCGDVLTNDLAFVVRTEERSGLHRAEHVDLYVGGSTAYRANDSDSFPQLASWLGTVPIADALTAAEMLIGMFARRDTAGPRHFRRWKYVVQRTGLDTLVDQFRQQADGRVDLRRESPPALAGNGPKQPSQLHPERGQTADGRLWLRLTPPQGRLTAAHLPTLQRLRAANASLRVGPQHDLIASFAPGTLVSDGQLAAGPWLRAGQSQRACPALPTCPLAVAGAETEWPIWAAAIEQAATRAAVPPPQWAISGCANGCSRPLTSALGLVAESPSKRAVFLGGSPLRLGQRVGYIDTAQQLVDLLLPWLTRYQAEKAENEGFSDWFWRTERK